MDRDTVGEVDPEIKHYRVSWECPLVGKVLVVVNGESKEHAFAKLLGKTLYQSSLLNFLGDMMDREDFGIDKLTWEVEDGLNGHEITFITFDEAATCLTS